MSVATPWPVARRPAARSITVTSPSASSPPVTASTVYWRSSHSVPVAFWIAWKIASTGPSPLDSPTASSPEGIFTATRRQRLAPGAGLDLEPGQLVGLGALAHLVGDDRLEVQRGHLLLVVGDLLEALEGRVQRVALDLEAELLQRVAQRVAAGVLAEHDRVRLEADLGRVHDLVGGALLQHAVLVDAGLVGEGVAADDRLVRLHRVAGQARDHAARAGQLARVDAGAAGRGRPRGVRTSITISSSEQLPARSPMPLIAHSTWRAPASTPA